MVELAIVGGGPGGLMAAWHLKRKLGDRCRVTIFEASDRIGGKVVTGKFDTAPVIYEAGVAEIYDYSFIGPDPLRELIQHLGHQTIPMDAESVVMDGELIHGMDGMRRRYGAKTAQAIEDFRARCAEMITPNSYYEGIGNQDNEHPWAHITQDDLLEKEVSDPVAKRFFKAMARSDIATEPHLTNGLNALKNFVMDIDGYIGLYSIQNGNEKLIERLFEEIDATVEYNHRVLKVGRTGGGRYNLNMMNGKGPENREFDLVLMCLPHNWLATVQWEGEPLRRAMSKHVAYFDRPAHYLRVAALFDSPFWGDQLPGAWFMSETFGGCCVYVEGARHNVGKYGVLNWLIPGADALAFANLDDKALIETALKSLPASLGDARAHFLEGKVHRWLSAVNAIPGGLPVRDVVVNHQPEPKEHPGLVLVGDYLFDSTLNGLLDSADVATDLIVTELVRLHEKKRAAARVSEAKSLERALYDDFRNSGPYPQAWSRFYDVGFLTDLFRMVWPDIETPRVLVTGSASGELVGALRERGFDAVGIEKSRYAHGKTPAALKPFNKRGSLTALPFSDGEFDLVLDTALCFVAPRQAAKAIRELHRVSRGGVMFATLTSDLPIDLVEKYDLMRGVTKLGTWWEWSELFFENGFDLSMHRRDLLDAVWQHALQAGKAGPGQWYADTESLRYSFYDRVDENE